MNVGSPSQYSDETRRLIETLRRRRLRRRRLSAFFAFALVLALGAGAAFGLARSSGDRHAQPDLTSSTLATTMTLATAESKSQPTTTQISVVTPVTTAVKRPATTKTTQPPQPTSTSTEGKDPSPEPVIVIDPGHQAQADVSLEPIGPGSSRMKEKMSKGTYGVVTGLPESEVDLAISLRLREELEGRGIRVIMTRTSEDVNISNIERAQIANKASARLFIRVHCDAFQDSSARGIHVLYPARIPGWTDDIYEASRHAARLAQDTLIAATGAKDRGLDERDDMTGFNWSDVPVIMPELGFMTNPEEDRLLASDEYQLRLARALADASIRFLRGD